MLVAVIVVAFVLGLGGCSTDDPGREPAREQAAQGAGGTWPPPPRAAIPRGPAALAARLTTTQQALDRAVERWSAGGQIDSGAPPDEVTLLALHQQRIHILLASRPRLARQVLHRVPGHVAAHLRATIRARRKLAPLATPQPLERFRTGPPEPAGVLRRHYRAAERRFGVDWYVLAAVNFVESAFGRMRNSSTAGAQGPMQFIPSTWTAYGMGGNVHEPRDAILGAANYLHANGAPRDYRRALYAYNPSTRYVDAVLAYAARMRRDARAYPAYYAWQVFVRTPQGVRRITGPGV